MKGENIMQNPHTAAIERLSQSILFTETLFETAQAETDAIIADIVRGAR